MKTKSQILVAGMIIVALLSATVLLFGIMYDLTYVENKEVRTNSMNPELSSFGENTYVVWSEAKDSEFFDVYLRKITNGNILDEAINLTQGKSFYPRPQVLASENNVYVLWEDRADKHGYDGDSIYFKKSNDYGQTFDQTMAVGSSNVDSISYTPITMTESSGILYVFMFQWNPQTDEKIIIFRASHDSGNTFGKPVSFFQFDKKWASLFDTVSAGDTTYAVSADDHGYSDETGKIHFRKIHPDGRTGEIVTLNKTGKFVSHLDISVPKEDGSNVYVVSREIADERKPDSGLVLEKPSLFFTKSIDGGDTFEESIKINTDLESEGVETQSVRIKSYDSHVYIMWKEGHSDGYDHFSRTWFAKSSDNGDTFDVVTISTLDDLRSKYGNVYVYEENKALYFIVISKTHSFHEDGTMYFAKSGGDGLMISKVTDVVGKPLPIMDAPKVAIHENHVQIVNDVLHEKNCILYVSSSDGGESFSEPVNLSPHGSLEDCFTK